LFAISDAVHPAEVVKRVRDRIGRLRPIARKVQRWIPRVDGVLTTGSLSTGLPDDFYARILDYARMRGKITAIDASGAALHVGLQAHPAFTKPNTDEFHQLINLTNASCVFPLAPHTALTLGRAGAVLIHDGACLYATPPRIFHTNPIGAGDAFAAGYLKCLLAARCRLLRLAMASAASDAATLRQVSSISLLSGLSPSSGIEVPFSFLVFVCFFVANPFATAP
jgi:fructose-1-phosphate kinase PfkB-like protein